jgi:hypothetical protein
LRPGGTTTGRSISGAGELSRLVAEAMRDAGKPLPAGEIAAGITAAKRFPDAAHLTVMKIIVTARFESDCGVRCGRRSAVLSAPSVVDHVLAPLPLGKVPEGLRKQMARDTLLSIGVQTSL